MIQVDLSDFTGDELARLRKERQDAHEAELTKFNDRKREHQARVDSRRREYKDAWASRRYLKAVILWGRFMLEPSSSIPSAPAISAATERERILEAGAAGQRVVIERLAARLDDRWVALNGHLNFKGEVDIVLIGPGGIACIEVKTLNAEVAVDGDEWRRQFCGRNGHSLARKRSWSTREVGRRPARSMSQPNNCTSGCSGMASTRRSGAGSCLRMRTPALAPHGTSQSTQSCARTNSTSSACWECRMLCPLRQKQSGGSANSSAATTSTTPNAGLRPVRSAPQLRRRKRARDLLWPDATEALTKARRPPRPSRSTKAAKPLPRCIEPPRNSRRLFGLSQAATEAV